jgi:hypothetical protein
LTITAGREYSNAVLHFSDSSLPNGSPPTDGERFHIDAYKPSDKKMPQLMDENDETESDKAYEYA